jgi:hypothetical protein
MVHEQVIRDSRLIRGKLLQQNWSADHRKMMLVWVGDRLT